MSGGHFDYKQHQIRDCADELEILIRENSYSPETMIKFNQAYETVLSASKMVQRVDWLVSCDDGEEEFHTRWDEEI
jgi:hypothetical protein